MGIPAAPCLYLWLSLSRCNAIACDARQYKRTSHSNSEEYACRFFDRSTALAAWFTALLAGTTAVEVVTVGVSVTLVDSAVALA